MHYFTLTLKLHNMKLFYCTLFGILICGSIFAQEKKLLQNFKYRIDRFRAVNLTTDVGGGLFDRNTLNGGKESFTSGNLNGNLFNFKSTNNKRILLQFGLSGNFSKAKNDDISMPTKNSSLNNGFSLNNLNTWYRKKIFFEAGANINGLFGVSNSKTFENIKLSNLKNNYSDYSVTFGIGSGRIENITDMQNALWLNKALQLDNILSKNLSEEELNNLGKAITKGNNTRILDNRRRIQFLLKTVDAFLQQKGVIKEININYFNTLNDILFYAINNQRPTGSELYFRVTPQKIAQNLNNTNFTSFPTSEYKNENKFQKNVVLFSAGYKKYIPQSLTHQNNFGAALKVNIGNILNTRKNFINNNITNELSKTDDIQQTSIDLFYEHSIYPNTRTNINFGLKTSLGAEKVNLAKQNFSTVSLGADINYFINYNTRFIASIGGFYNKNKTDFNNLTNNTTDNLSLQTRIGLELNF